MSEPNPSVPYGYCQCGCGERTVVNTRADRRRGWFIGQPRKYLLGHIGRSKAPVDYIIDPDSGCWLWQRGHHPGGHGFIHVDGRQCYAHRVYYERTHGPIPEGYHVHHRCENPPCVNPEHLIALSSSHHRLLHSRLVLTREDIAEIRQLVASGLSFKRTADRVGVSKATVQRVMNGSRQPDPPALTL